MKFNNEPTGIFILHNTFIRSGIAWAQYGARADNLYVENNIFIGTSNELGALESGLTAALFGPVVSVVAGGIGTIQVVLGVAALWPETRKIGALDRHLR